MTRAASSTLDKRLARVIALGVAALAAAVLLYIERGRLEETPKASNDPREVAFALCFDQASATINGMQKDGIVDDAKAELFLQRAEARCRAEAEAAPAELQD
ncbi:MAG: hypothetical protein R3245_06570 [Kiloniellales bacterium]|nr:hypothetical protein [Kiloniellales bacterium]